MKRIWIIDGHNLIFAIGVLQEMQISGRGEEARGGLSDALRRFAQTRGEQVLVVFDGGDRVRNPDVPREPFFEIVYATRGEGNADSRIIHEARLRAEHGQHVTVVTNDVRTLAVDLPKRVLHMRVKAFWQKYIERAADPDGKRVEGDFADIERELVARAALAEPEPAARIPAARKPPASSPESAPAERLPRKKERGRLRQERRLLRRTGAGRRR